MAATTTAAAAAAAQQDSLLAGMSPEELRALTGPESELLAALEANREADGAPSSSAVRRQPAARH
jgi:hypothetical protein